MASSPKVSLLFLLGMAIRHRASSLFSLLVLRPSVSLRSIRLARSLALVASLTYFLVLGFFRVWPYCPYVVNRGMQYRRYDGNSTFNQHNQVSPPSGHWNRDIGTPSRSTGTLEPRVHREGKGHRPENQQRAPTREPAPSLSVIPSGVVGGFSAAWFMAARFIAVLLMEVTTS